MKRLDWAYVLLLGALSALFLWPLWGLEKAYYSLDFFGQILPAFHWLHLKYSAGLAPLWSQDVLLGYPFLDEGLTGYFYPPQRLILTYFDAIPAIALFYGLHLFLAAGGAYAFARSLGLSSGAAFVAGIASGFGGGMAYSLHHPANVVSLAWLPWQFLSISLLASPLSSRRGCGSLLLGLSLAMPVVGGHLVITIYGLLALAFYAWHLLRKGGLSLAVLLRAGLGAGLLAALLAGGQLAMTRRYVSQSIRQDSFDYAGASKDSLSPASLIHPVLPMAFGDPNDNSYLGASWHFGTWIHQGLLLFVGLLLLSLALYAAFSAWSRAAPFLLALGFLVLYALGSYSPLHKLMFHLPLFGHFRAPMKAASLSGFLLGMPAAIGLEQLLKLKRLPKALWVGLAALALALLGAGVALALGRARLDAWGQSYIQAKVIGSAAHHFSADVYAAKLGRWINGLRWHCLAQGAFASAALLLLWAGLKRPAWLGLLAGLLAFAELSYYGSSYYPVIDRKIYDQEPAMAKEIHARGKETRYFYWGWADLLRKAYPQGVSVAEQQAEFHMAELLHGNSGLFWDLKQVRGYTPIGLARVDSLLARTNDYSPETGQAALMLQDRKNYDLASAGYFVSSQALPAPGLKLLKDGELKLYENLQAKPLAWLEGASGKVALGTLSDEGWNLKTQAAQAGTLVLSRAWYGGIWKAELDGKPAELLQAHGALCGLALPAGAHEISLSLQDPLLGPAKAMAGLGWLLLVFFAALFWRRDREAA